MIWTQEEVRKLQKLKLYHNGARQANRFDNPSKGKVEEFDKLSYEDVKKKIFSIRYILSAYARCCPRTRHFIARAARMRARVQDYLRGSWV